jgi:ribonuclease PH
LALDLCYEEDKDARVDLNVVATGKGGIVEIQGTAEGRAVPRKDIDEMVDLGLSGIARLCQKQQEILEIAGVSLPDLMVP